MQPLRSSPWRRTPACRRRRRQLVRGQALAEGQGAEVGVAFAAGRRQSAMSRRRSGTPFHQLRAFAFGGEQQLVDLGASRRHQGRSLRCRYSMAKRSSKATRAWRSTQWRRRGLIQARPASASVGGRPGHAQIVASAAPVRAKLSRPCAILHHRHRAVVLWRGEIDIAHRSADRRRTWPAPAGPRCRRASAPSPHLVTRPDHRIGGQIG